MNIYRGVCGDALSGQRVLTTRAIYIYIYTLYNDDGNDSDSDRLRDD